VRNRPLTQVHTTNDYSVSVQTASDGGRFASQALTITITGDHGPAQAIEKPAVSSGFRRADEGTRTLDLLYGKDRARADSE
jgi:hypothetical protein